MEDQLRLAAAVKPVTFWLELGSFEADYFKVHSQKATELYERRSAADDNVNHKLKYL